MPKNNTPSQFSPLGEFDLKYQNQFFNGWPILNSDSKTVVMAFPVEGWSGSAAVTLNQATDGSLDISVYGEADVSKAKAQALAALSLDEDGSDWKNVGEKDAVVLGLQKKYHYLRPSLFNSPYEAAAAFIIGHRITIVQGRKIRENIAKDFGDEIAVDGELFYAFPSPQKLMTIESYKGLNETKIDRLKAVAQAAIDGMLDRSYLKSLNEEEALTKLETLPGIGPFFSQGILYRGVGIKDGFTEDDMTFHAIKTAYGLPKDVSKKELLAIAEKWRPYRMWVIVMLHIWLRETNNFPKRTFSKR